LECRYNSDGFNLRFFSWNWIRFDIQALENSDGMNQAAYEAGVKSNNKTTKEEVK
jgi:hypothetical protein